MVKATNMSSLIAGTTARRSWREKLISLPGLAVLGLLVVSLSLFVGAYELRPAEVIRVIAASLGLADAESGPAVSYLLWNIRMPRIALAMLVGGMLAISGAALQALFRNPLADPALVGVTSGAMLFTVAGLVLGNPLSAWLGAGFNYLTLAFLGFLGGALSTWLVYRLATFGRTTYVATMLLAGVAVSAIAAAVTGLFTYFSDEAQLRDITFWTLGSLSGANWSMVGLLFAVSLIVVFGLMRHAGALNLFLLGEQEAAFTGVNTERTKRVVILCTALGVGACVSASGMIGFVGLVVPHLLRLARGAELKWLLPASAISGGILLTVADTVARSAIAPAELPIGVLTALIGGPFFLWLLIKGRGRFSVHL